MSGDNARWGDLRTRLISAVLLLLVGGAAVWFGGAIFSALVIGLTAAMFWELARMTAPEHRITPIGMAIISAFCLWGAVYIPAGFAIALPLIPAIALALPQRKEARFTSVYGLCLMIAGYGFIELRSGGAAHLLWLVLIVITSDVAGYFVGRRVGGPKFWSAISPKKTWSGTIAGWVGAVLVATGFVVWGNAPMLSLLLAPFVAFAGQMGDIAESWIKRRTGVKDSSALIPGHGGVLDRFDALTWAAMLVFALSLLTTLPLPVGG